MKEKNGKILLMATIFAFVGFLFPSDASAANQLPNAVNGKITLSEDVTLDSGYVVKKGENITLDLAGYTLTTTSGLKADTIYVTNGATLTITGNGTVKNATYGYAPILNNGTTNIKGGNFIDEKSGSEFSDASERNYYIVLNHGIMTIEGGTFKTSGTFSSLIENGYYSFDSKNERNGHIDGVNEEYPTLKINGGNFDGGLNTVKNDDNGKLTINNGTFTNTVQVSLLNWNEATINGGTFDTPTGKDKTNISVGSYGADSVDRGILVINGGTFNAEHVLESIQNKGVTTDVIINGGTFNNKDSFLNEAQSAASLKNDGVKITGNVTAGVSALKYAQKGAVVTLNEVPTENFEIPEGVTVKVSEDKELVKNDDGTYSIIEKKQENTNNEQTNSSDSKLDDVPKTGSTFPIILFGLVMLSAISGAYALKVITAKK